MPNTRPSPIERRLIYKDELLRIVPLSYTTIWKMMRNGELPHPVVASGRSMWWLDEVHEALEALPRRRLKGDPPEE